MSKKQNSSFLLKLISFLKTLFKFLMQRKFILGTLSVAILISGYAYLSHKQHLKNPDDTTIPNYTQLKEGVKKSIEVNRRTEERWLLEDSKSTAKRFFLGLVYGISGAVLLGLLMGSFKSIEELFVPPLTLLAKLPPTAALAVFFVMVGTETKMYVTMIALGILPTLAQAVYLSVKDVPIENIYKAKTLGAKIPEIIWNIVFKQVWPKIVDSIRLQIGPAMVYLIAAEMVCADVGFGYRIRLQSRLLDMSVVYPYLVLLMAFGFAMDFTLRKVIHWFGPWYEKKGD